MKPGADIFPWPPGARGPATYKMRQSYCDIHGLALWYLDSNPIPAWHPAGLHRGIWRVRRDLRLQTLLATKGPMAARFLLDTDGLKLVKGGKKKEKKISPLNCSGVIALWVTLYLSPPPAPALLPPSHSSLCWLEPNLFHHEPLKPVIVKVTGTASDKRVVPRWLSHSHFAAITLLMERQQPRALHKKSNLVWGGYNLFLGIFSEKCVCMRICAVEVFCCLRLVRH